MLMADLGRHWDTAIGEQAKTCWMLPRPLWPDGTPNPNPILNAKPSSNPNPNSNPDISLI